MGKKLLFDVKEIATLRANTMVNEARNVILVKESLGHFKKSLAVLALVSPETAIHTICEIYREFVLNGKIDDFIDNRRTDINASIKTLISEMTDE